ncbi:hypothetical protein RFI_18713, partial [Reticulomyxa filosa]
CFRRQKHIKRRDFILEMLSYALYHFILRYPLTFAMFPLYRLALFIQDNVITNVGTTRRSIRRQIINDLNERNPAVAVDKTHFEREWMASEYSRAIRNVLPKSADVQGLLNKRKQHLIWSLVRQSKVK